MVSEFLHQHFQPLINYEFTKQMEDSLDQIVKRETDLATLCQSCSLLINQCLEPLGVNSDSAFVATTSSNKEALGTFEDVSVYLKKGKFGYYAQWGEKTKNLKEFNKLTVEEITWDKVLPLLEEGSPILREINKDVSIRRGPKGNYIFYKPPKAKKPMFLSFSGFENDFTSCNIEIIKSWIREKHNIHFA
jgi:DNA topoisomerase-1